MTLKTNWDTLTHTIQLKYIKKVIKLIWSKNLFTGPSEAINLFNIKFGDVILSAKLCHIGTKLTQYG